MPTVLRVKAHHLLWREALRVLEEAVQPLNLPLPPSLARLHEQLQRSEQVVVGDQVAHHLRRRVAGVVPAEGHCQTRVEAAVQLSWG